MESIIGKKYYVVDNSYQQCIEDGRNHSLAGYYGKVGQVVKIVSEPFKMQVYFNVTKKHYIYDFIVVEHEGKRHITLFFKRGLELSDLTVQELIKREERLSHLF